MTEIRAMFAAVMLFAVGGLLGLATDPPPGLPDDALARLPVDLGPGGNPWLRVPVEGLWTIGVALGRHPHAVLAGTAVLTLPYVAATIVSLVPRRVVRDPQRLFTKQQRQAAAHAAGDRCEMENLWYLRCRRHGSHGDHWIPHSKGGASSMDNLVWACSLHNLAKGARMPTWGQTLRLELRRRRYIAPGIPTRPGARYRR